MRQFKVLATTPAKASYNDFSGESCFFADSLLYVEIYSNYNSPSIVITDISNAMKPGKTCQQVKFTGVWNSNKCEVANLMHQYNGDFRKIFAALAEIPAVKYNAGTDVVLGDVAGRAYNSEQPSIKQFSPFAKLNRLKEAPAKWTLAHVVRALVNGQFSGLSCHGKYTDDYAYDSATNFGKAFIPAGGLIQELVDSKSGWWVSASTGAESTYLTLGCYGFKSYGFTLNLSGQAAPLKFDTIRDDEPAPEPVAAPVLAAIEPEAPAPALTLAECVSAFLAKHPATICEQHPNGNMMLSEHCETEGSPLIWFCAQLNALPVTYDLEAENGTVYLAIYPHQRNPTPPTPEPKPEPQPLLAALSAVMQVVRDERPAPAAPASEHPPRPYSREEIRAREAATIAEAEAVGYKIPGLYELGKRAHDGTSFDPEKRALSIVRTYQPALAADIAKIEAAGREYNATPERIQEVTERYAKGYIQRLNNWLSAKSRCISSMITGPANFPTRRAEKANNSEHNRMGEFIEYYENNVRRAIHSLKPPVVKPTNPNAKPVEPRSFELNGQAGQILVNLEVDRVQLVFDSKPDAETITKLKSSGFRWSPRFTAWQRQDTPNGRYAVQRLTGIAVN